MIEREQSAPENLEEKEVFAFFGLASYLGSCLEEQLSSFAAMLVLINKALGLKASGIGASAMRKVANDAFDQMEARTLGQLLTEARKLTAFSAEIDKELKDALRERNFLVHHFFRHHAANFTFERGRERMIRQLREIAALFERANAHLENVRGPLMAKYGVTPPAVANLASEMVAQAKRDSAT